jgi:TPR repeat protein
MMKAIRLESIDKARAGHILAALCEAGDMDACSEATVVLDVPSNSARDGQKAAACGKRACEAGRGHDCFTVGLLFWHGRRDVARNYATAVHLYTVGCNHDDQDACAELSAAYRKGLGVKRDRARANAIWKKAEALGYRGE